MDGVDCLLWKVGRSCWFFWGKHFQVELPCLSLVLLQAELLVVAYLRLRIVVVASLVLMLASHVREFVEWRNCCGDVGLVMLCAS